MRTEDGPKGRATKRFPAARDDATGGDASAHETAVIGGAAATTTAGGAATAAVGGETQAVGGETASGETPAVGGKTVGGETAGGEIAKGAGAAAGLVDGEPSGPVAGMGGPPVLERDRDPEIRRRIAMAAESDLEASRYAHWRGTVTFHDVANAWFNMSDPNLSDDLRAEFKTIFPGLLDAFAEPRKGIITAYFCRHIRVAAALTDIGHAAGAAEGVPEATLKGPPPEGIRALLLQEAPETVEANGHGEPGVAGEMRRDAETRGRGETPGRGETRQGAETRGRGETPGHGETRARGAGIVAQRRAERDRRPFWQRCLHLFDPAPASSSAIHIEPTFGDPADWKAKELLFHCLNLHYKALEFLTPQPRKICMRMIFGVIATLLGTLDARALDSKQGRGNLPFGSDPAEVETLERELAQAQAYYHQAAQRQAQLEYLLGMLTAIIPAAAITAIIAITAGLLDNPATVAVLGGAIGATVSVMARMSNGSIELKPESGKKTIRALGFMRPVIGGVFGAVIYAFLAGGIIELVTPPTGNAELAFYAGLGFLSGFSERFAQDVIAEGSAKTQPPPGTASSPVRP